MSTTNAAWAKIGIQLDLVKRLASGEPIRVSADKIKRITGREPRLMTKFDYRAQRPPVLQDATILPVSNGEYLIVPGDGYHDIEPSKQPAYWPLPATAKKLLSLPWSSGPASEGQLLDMALASGMLSHFLGEEVLALTIRGRLRSPSFAFEFSGNRNSIQVNISGVQVEVDAGIEGGQLHLVEAKLGKRSDFLVRQLYYPFRMWQSLLPAKQCTALFVSYSDKVISLRQYQFDPAGSYHGITLTKSADFVLGHATKSQDLSTILESSFPESAPKGVTFPQADDMWKVLDIVDATASGLISDEEIVGRYGFTTRQASYYRAAASYLGLLEPKTARRVLTPMGKSFVKLNRDQRHKLVISRLASLPVFRDALKYALANNGNFPPVGDVLGWITVETERAKLPLSSSTLRRRAATVKSWTEWALESTTGKLRARSTTTP